MLFDRLVIGHVLDVNPAHAVCGPRYVVTKGKTPVLTADEARAILDAIPTATLTGLRDRALIGVMVYTFARVNAVIGMEVKDYFTQGRRGWVRLRETGGKEHAVPATTRWSSCSTPISPPPASPTTQTACCSAPPGARPEQSRRCGSRTPTG